MASDARHIVRFSDKSYEAMDQLETLLCQITSLQKAIKQAEKDYQVQLNSISPAKRSSALNFVQYLTLRQFDIRKLQTELRKYGLSSLGDCESSVAHSLNLVASNLEALSQSQQLSQLADNTDEETGSALLQKNCSDLLGSHKRDRPSIVVTMPSHAGHHPTFIRDCLNKGMTSMRINCSHDSPVDWLAMIDTLRKEELARGEKCNILMDLPGPKLRTGNLVADVVKVRPIRDKQGRVKSPGRVIFSAIEHCCFEPSLIIPQEILEKLELGT
jgi:pyruvate kinase